jgi:CheY-like chemotaxis protein
MAPGTQTQVLVVEDNAVDALMIRRAFGGAGLLPRYHTVACVEEAMRYLQGSGPYANRKNHPLPDLVVIDVRLPDRSGLELLRWMREQSAFAAIPVIVLTGTGNRSLEQAYDLGAHFYLLKPLASDELNALLPALLAADKQAAQRGTPFQAEA